MVKKNQQWVHPVIQQDNQTSHRKWVNFRTLSLVIIAGISTVHFSNLANATHNKGHKSLPRLKVGLKSVEEALRAAESRRAEVRKQKSAIEGQLRAIGRKLREVESKRPETSDRLEAIHSKLKFARSAKQALLRNAPRDREELQTYLKELIDDGRGKEVSLAIEAKYSQPVSFSNRELKVEVKSLSTVSVLQRNYDEMIERLQSQVDDFDRELEPENESRQRLMETQEDLKNELKGLIDEEIKLTVKIQKCQTDLKHIRAEMKVVAQLKSDEESTSDDDDEEHFDPPKSAMSSIVFRNFFRPVAGQVTSLYGVRLHPIKKINQMHGGIDLAGKIGDPVYSANSGSVSYAGPAQGYGNLIVIDHGSGLSTAYGHLSEILVTAGTKVKRGTIVGAVGTTGNSTGPHLHFEVRKDGKAVDPTPYL